MRGQLATVIGLQIVLLGLVGYALVSLRRIRTEIRHDTAALAHGLEGPFQRLAAEWQAEHQRLAQVSAHASELVTRLARLQHQATVTATDQVEAESEAGHSRQEARRRLLDGESAEQVAEATGLPHGEVRVLASVLKAQGGSQPGL